MDMQHTGHDRQVGGLVKSVINQLAVHTAATGHAQRLLQGCCRTNMAL